MQRFTKKNLMFYEQKKNSKTLRSNKFCCAMNLRHMLRSAEQKKKIGTIDMQRYTRQFIIEIVKCIECICNMQYLFGGFDISNNLCLLICVNKITNS